MSTESGLPDFRVQRRPVEAEPPLRGARVARGVSRATTTSTSRSIAGAIEMLAAHEPNDGHRVVADWQRRGLVATVITQNVDGFHTRAGAEGCSSCTARSRTCAAIAAAAERPAAEFLDGRRPRLRLRRQAPSGRRAVRRGAARGDAARGLDGGRARAAVPGARLVAGGRAREPAARGGGRRRRAAGDRQPRSDAARSHRDAGDQRVDRGYAAGRWIGSLAALWTRAPSESDRIAGIGTSIFTEITALAVKHEAVNLGPGLPRFPGARLRQAGGGAPHPRRPQPVRRQPGRAAAARGAGRRLAPPVPGRARRRSGERDHRRQRRDRAAARRGLATVNPGDEVIVFEPAYDAYAPDVAMAGGVVRAVPLRAARLALRSRAAGGGVRAAHARADPEHAPQPDGQGVRARRAGGDRGAVPCATTCW